MPFFTRGNNWEEISKSTQDEWSWMWVLYIIQNEQWILFPPSYCTDVYFPWQQHRLVAWMDLSLPLLVLNSLITFPCRCVHVIEFPEKWVETVYVPSLNFHGIFEVYAEFYVCTEKNKFMFIVHLCIIWTREFRSLTLC